MTFPAAPSGVTRWTFTDPSDSSTATFEFNPDAGGTPDNAKHVSASSRLFNGKTCLWVTSQETQKIEFSGIIVSEEMYNLVTEWFNKTNPIELTDDLGRTFTIVIQTFEPRRERQSLVPWYHTYTVSALITS